MSGNFQSSSYYNSYHLMQINIIKLINFFIILFYINIILYFSIKFSYKNFHNLKIIFLYF